MIKQAAPRTFLRKDWHVLIRTCVLLNLPPPQQLWGYQMKTLLTIFMNQLPIIYLAFCMADLVQSTLVPREQNPWESGGLTDTIATSRFRIFCRNSLGISLRKIGMASARPSLMAVLELPPTNRELDLKMSKKGKTHKKNMIKKQVTWSEKCLIQINQGLLEKYLDSDTNSKTAQRQQRKSFSVHLLHVHIPCLCTDHMFI